MKIAVVGSRNFIYKKFVMAKLIAIISGLEHYDDVLIVSGGAQGVDSWAEEIALRFKIPKIIFKPDWNKYGKRAGFIRNELIINEADKVIAFWDGESKGTKHSIDLAIKAKKHVDIYVRS